MKKIYASFFLLFFFFLSCSLSLAQADGANSAIEYNIKLVEPIGVTETVKGGTGITLLNNYISAIYKYGASILGIICVLIIVISGIQITMGGADDGLVTDAKTRIMQALLSLALLFLSAVILKTINPGFFKKTETTALTPVITTRIALSTPSILGDNRQTEWFLENGKNTSTHERKT